MWEYVSQAGDWRGGMAVVAALVFVGAVILLLFLLPKDESKPALMEMRSRDLKPAAIVAAVAAVAGVAFGANAVRSNGAAETAARENVAAITAHLENTYGAETNTDALYQQVRRFSQAPQRLGPLPLALPEGAADCEVVFMAPGNIQTSVAICGGTEPPRT